VTELEAEDRPTEEARRQLAAAVRELIAITVSANLDDQVLARAADEVGAISTGLTAEAGTGKRPRYPPNFADPPQDFFPGSPATGLVNPIAPPIRVWRVEGVDGGYAELHGEVNFDYQYEGPPACVHGGVIAEAFDEVLGAANLVAGNPAMTGTLTIRYRKPTPLRTNLRIEARCVGREGRKVRTWGGIYQGDDLTAEAEGLFIMVRPDKLLAAVEANQNSTDPEMMAAMRAEVAAANLRDPKRQAP
jgi:acyl-coenzyme A thioesterase PaaI-like protein